MKTRSLLAVAAFCAALALPGLAAAQSIAYAARDGYTNLRSGPSTNYPVIARVYPGSPVDVLGCLDTRAWCDVVIEDIRGWIYASRLEFVYGGRRVYVPDYYSYFGAPIIQFHFGNDNRYRHHRRRGGDWRDPDQSVSSPPNRGSLGDYDMRPRGDDDGGRGRSFDGGPSGGNDPGIPAWKLPCAPNSGCPE